MSECQRSTASLRERGRSGRIFRGHDKTVADVRSPSRPTPGRPASWGCVRRRFPRSAPIWSNFRRWFQRLGDVQIAIRPISISAGAAPCRAFKANRRILAQGRGAPAARRQRGASRTLALRGVARSERRRFPSDQIGPVGPAWIYLVRSCCPMCRTEACLSRSGRQRLPCRRDRHWSPTIRRGAEVVRRPRPGMPESGRH